jgi:shikimate kinase / 3-dehydroquinate synthase
VDEAVSRISGKEVGKIIRVEGENRFRELESNALEEALKAGTQVVSLGGGGFLSEGNRKLVKKHRGVSVFLSVSSNVAASRIRAQNKQVDRPFVQGAEDDDISKLMNERMPIYQEADVKVWTDFSNPKEIARVVFGECSTRDGKVVVIPFLEECSVVIGSGLLSSIWRRIRLAFPKARKVCVVIDERVASILRAKFESSLDVDSLEAFFIEVPAGERSKCLSVVKEMAIRMNDEGISRLDVVVGVGGGVVGDLAGFLASTYMRGIGLVHVPTSVVSQVDSSIGGKTALNLWIDTGNCKERVVKNSVGTFYPAKLIVSDIDLLKTLPEREYLSGMAEVVKYGLIASSEFFEWLEKNTLRIIKRDSRCLLEIVEFCSRTKLEIVQEDMLDTQGKRMWLNFGHTVGHAVEGSFPEDYMHGEAVSVGMVVALKFGEFLGTTVTGLSERIESLLREFKLPVRLPDKLVEGSSFKSSLMADKKRKSKGLIDFVFVSVIGKAEAQEVAVKEIVDFVVNSSSRN